MRSALRALQLVEQWRGMSVLIFGYREYCSSKNITVIDLAASIPQLSLPLDKRREYWDDGIHFTPKGYDQFGEIVFNIIKDDLGSPLQQQKQLQ